MSAGEEPAALPPVHICVRETLDWNDEAIVRERIHPRFRAKFDVWNRTLTMPYHEFRARLKAIAAGNLARVAHASVSPLASVPAGHIVVPVDDDDWFAPDLVAWLRSAPAPPIEVWLWTRLALQPERRSTRVRRQLARLLGRGERHVCKTNNYAVRSAPTRQAVAANHVEASRYVDAHPGLARRIDRTLAIQNRSLASQTTLAWGAPAISPAALVALLGRYRNFYERWTPPASLEWAVPYVRLMAELMAGIGTRSGVA
jgi:hypothetical protein